MKANAHATAREIFVNVEHSMLGKVALPGFPIKFSEAKGDISIPVPLLRQYNEAVYAELLSLSGDKIEELRSQGVI